MRRITFIIREGVRALGRSGLAGWLAVLSLAVFAAFGSSIWTARQTLAIARQDLLSRFELEAFIMPGRDYHLDEVADWLRTRPGVAEVEEIDKSKAAERFSRLYGDDLFELLDENPLPVSVIVRYNPDVVNIEWITKEAEEIGNHVDIDEVAYEGELLSQLEEASGEIGLILIVVAASIAAIALFFTIQSVRVAVRGSQAWANAILLVGGTHNQVRQPFVMAGLLAGLTGGFFGVGLIAAAQFLLAQGGMTPAPDFKVLIAVMLLTMVVGALGASAAIRKPSWRRWTA